MRILPHKYGALSFFLKILAIIALIDQVINIWNIKTSYPLIGFFTNQTFWEFVFTLPLQYTVFSIIVIVALLLDYPKILYLFPIVAYYLLIGNICYLISFNQNQTTTILVSSLPSQLEALSTSLLLILGMLILSIWHKKNITIQPSKSIQKNLQIVALLSYFVLIIMSFIVYQNFSYYLDKKDGFVALALNSAGLRHLILLGFICIFGLKKWPSILWLFPFMAYSFTWTYLKGLIYYPEKYTFSLQVATIFLIVLTILGLYTLYLWIRQLMDEDKNSIVQLIKR